MNEYSLELQAIEIFKNALPSRAKEIKAVRQLHDGYTNMSFAITLRNGDKYQVRIPHDGGLVNRKLEIAALKATHNNHFVYFDEKTGIAVKKWIDGYTPSKHLYKSEKFLDALFTKIKKIHQTKLGPGHRFRKINLDVYNSNLQNLKFEYQRKFLCLQDRRRSEPVVLNHSDINPDNVVWDGNDVHIIDFEWTTLASEYWDYANWIRETNIKVRKVNWSKYIKNYDKEKMADYIFLCTVFAYLWTYSMPQTSKILSYRKKILKQIRRAYRYVVTHEKVYYN